MGMLRRIPLQEEELPFLNLPQRADSQDFSKILIGCPTKDQRLAQLLDRNLHGPIVPVELPMLPTLDRLVFPGYPT